MGFIHDLSVVLKQCILRGNINLPTIIVGYIRGIKQVIGIAE